MWFGRVSRAHERIFLTRRERREAGSPVSSPVGRPDPIETFAEATLMLEIIGKALDLTVQEMAGQIEQGKGRVRGERGGRQR